MAAQSSPHTSPTAAAASTRHAASAAAGNNNNSASGARRKSVVSGPEEMLLLREKLNEIAVGLRFRRDSEELADGDSDAEAREQRRRRQGGAHFKVFPLRGERPSTPPSSPQPRDVLRKQLRLRNSSFRLDDLPSHRRSPLTNNSNSGNNDSDCELDDGGAVPGVSVDAVEIARLDASPRVRLSIPGHLRARSASSAGACRVLAALPEGLRKRKSDHVADLVADAPLAAPLKKVSSQKNMLGAGAWDYDALAADAASARARSKDHDMEDASPESPDCVAFAGGMPKLCS